MVGARVFTVLLLTIVGALAFSPKHFGQLSPASIELQADTSCYYNIFLTNFASTGFGGASVTVQINGQDLENFSGLSLPDALDQSGWTLPVVSGSFVTINYTAGLNHSGNGVLITNANGASLLDMQMDGHETFSFDLGAVSCECEYPTEEECPEVRVRNEWRSLSYCDKKLFIRALNKLRNTTDSSGANMYEKFILHHTGVTTEVLANSLFLPWHRGFILKFEEHLRMLGGEFSCIALPYWDSGLDFGYERKSEVVKDLGGFEKAACLSSPFEWWTDPVPINDPSLNSSCVYRQTYPAEFKVEQLPTAAALDLAVVANKNYEYIFRYLVRNPHKSVHVFVGGSMGTIHSPADPLFFLHHANIDRIYAQWQDCWEYDSADVGSPNGQYGSVSPGSQFLPLTQPMPNLFPDLIDHDHQATVVDVLDILKLNYSYPPVMRSMVRLNASYGIHETQMCKWDWFNKEQQDARSLKYRLAVHNSEQRNRLSLSRAAHRDYLQKDSTAHYQAIQAQMAVECEMNGGYTAADFNPDFMIQVDNDNIIGPGFLFKNACKLLLEGTLDHLVASCYPGYSC